MDMQEQINIINEQRKAVMNEIEKDFNAVVDELFLPNKTPFLLGEIVRINGQIAVFIKDDGYSGVNSYVYNIDNSQTCIVTDRITYWEVATSDIQSISEGDITPNELKSIEKYPFQFDFWYGRTILMLKSYIR